MEEFLVLDKVDKNNTKFATHLYECLKRMGDIVLSIIGIIVTLPITLIVAILIKIEDGGSILFSQTRVGKHGAEFKMYKFRSMRPDAEKIKKELIDKNEMSGPMFKIKNDPRITKIGHFIRKTSIDELPQLLNIIKGEMSIVGPRPSLPHEVEEFEPWMLERLEVKPGLTCFWQVGGRNAIDFENWMKLDVKYVRERNLLLDIKLIFMTFKVFLGDENAS